MALVPQDYQQHTQQLSATIEYFFPMLCYTEEDIAQFLDRQKKFRGKSTVYYRFEYGEAAALIKADPSPTSIAVGYIIPTDWNQRYPIVQAAVEALKDQARQQGIEELFTTINEEVPSHNAYYAGMLPLLGFSIAPRVRLVAPFEVLNTLTLPSLPAHITETGFLPDKLSEMASTYYQSHSGHHPDHSPQEQAAQQTYWQQSVEQWAQQEEITKTWTTLVCDGQIAGLCIGTRDTWHKYLEIFEIAVAPNFQAQGLGRYLFIRCMQKMHQHFAEAGWAFFVGTFRNWLPAMKLYASLGFRLDQDEEAVISYATCKINKSKDSF